METPQGSLENRPTAELLDALLQARSIESELEWRGLDFLRTNLATVEGFPTDRLNDCTARVNLDKEGPPVIVINIPTNRMGAGKKVGEAHELKLALERSLSSVSGVASVEKVGSMNSGIMSLDVSLLSDQLPAQSMPAAVEEVRGDVGKSLQDV